MPSDGQIVISPLVRLRLLLLQGELVDEVHRSGVVERTEYGSEGTEVAALVPPALASRLRPLRIDPGAEESESEDKERAVEDADWLGDTYDSLDEFIEAKQVGYMNSAEHRHDDASSWLV